MPPRGAATSAQHAQTQSAPRARCSALTRNFSPELSKSSHDPTAVGGCHVHGSRGQYGTRLASMNDAR